MDLRNTDGECPKCHTYIQGGADGHLAHTLTVHRDKGPYDAKGVGRLIGKIAEERMLGGDQ